MHGYLAHGERLRHWQAIGFAVALAGMVALKLHGFSAPSWGDALCATALPAQRSALQAASLAILGGIALVLRKPRI